MPIVSFNLQSQASSGGLFAFTPSAPQPSPITEPFFMNYGWGGTFGDLFPSEWDNNYVLFDITLGTAVSLPANLITSPAPNCYQAPLSDVTLTLQWVRSGVPVSIGTGVIRAGNITGLYSTNGVPYTIPFGDRARLIAPPTADQTMIGLSGVIVGTRLNS